MEAIEPRFLVVQLKSPLRTFYALHHDFVNRYGISCVTKDKTTTTRPGHMTLEVLS